MKIKNHSLAADIFRATETEFFPDRALKSLWATILPDKYLYIMFIDGRREVEKENNSIRKLNNLRLLNSRF